MMARSKTLINNELNETQILCSRLTMQIGQGYAEFNRTKDEKLMITLNEKIEAFKNAEVQLSLLEKELEITTD